MLRAKFTEETEATMRIMKEGMTGFKNHWDTMLSMLASESNDLRGWGEADDVAIAEYITLRVSSR